MGVSTQVKRPSALDEKRSRTYGSYQHRADVGWGEPYASILTFFGSSSRSKTWWWRASYVGSPPWRKRWTLDRRKRCFHPWHQQPVFSVWSQVKSTYNMYKLLGYDILLDSHRKPHLIEVNARPACLNNPLDAFVNRPMVGAWYQMTCWERLLSRSTKCSRLWVTTSPLTPCPT